MANKNKLASTYILRFKCSNCSKEHNDGVDRSTYPYITIKAPTPYTIDGLLEHKFCNELCGITFVAREVLRASKALS